MSDIVRDAVVGRGQPPASRARLILRLAALGIAAFVVPLAAAAGLAPSDGPEVLTALSGRW